MVTQGHREIKWPAYSDIARKWNNRGANQGPGIPPEQSQVNACSHVLQSPLFTALGLSGLYLWILNVQWRRASSALFRAQYLTPNMLLSTEQVSSESIWTNERTRQGRTPTAFESDAQDSSWAWQVASLLLFVLCQNPILLSNEGKKRHEEDFWFLGQHGRSLEVATSS